MLDQLSLSLIFVELAGLFFNFLHILTLYSHRIDSISNESRKIPSLPAEYKKVKELSFYNKTTLFSPVCIHVKCEKIGN